LNQWIAAAGAQKVGAVETAADFFKKAGRKDNRSAHDEVSADWPEGCA
jgi:hypothetical protein